MIIRFDHDEYGRYPYLDIDQTETLIHGVDYLVGHKPANYPVPAIPLRVVYGTDYMYDTIYIDDITNGDDPVMVAIIDFNWDRCMDFGSPYAEFYTPS